MLTDDDGARPNRSLSSKLCASLTEYRIVNAQSGNCEQDVKEVGSNSNPLGAKWTSLKALAPLTSLAPLY
jgi:hypothetical protein